jgi:TRAP-type C4-dicarboxylate transport system permease small subunit
MLTLKNYVDKVVIAFCALILSIMALLETGQFLMPSIFNQGAMSANMKLLFAPLIMLGSAYLFGKGGHIKLDFFKDGSSKTSKILAYIAQVCIIVFAGGVLFYGGLAAYFLRQESFTILEHFSFLSVPISGLLIVFYFVCGKAK